MSGFGAAAIEAQIKRFAPGFRDRIPAGHVRSATQMEPHNANNVGGDVVRVHRGLGAPRARWLAHGDRAPGATARGGGVEWPQGWDWP